MKRRFSRRGGCISMKGRANLILLKNISHLHLSLLDCHYAYYLPSQPSL